MSIKYSQIENLPADHPLVIQFNKEQAELDNPECQGADHRSEIVIDEDEFRKIMTNIKKGLQNPSNPAAMALAKMAFVNLSGYDVRGHQDNLAVYHPI